jgi:hypothetical protein
VETATEGKMKIRFAKQCVAFGMAAVIGLMGAVPRVNAMVAPVGESNAIPAMSRAEDLQKVQMVLQNKIVRQRLSDLGLSDQEIEKRLGKLSGEQLHQVAMQIDQQVAAGDDDDLLIGLAVGVLLVALIVWIMRALDDD